MNIMTEYLGYETKDEAEMDKQSSIIFKNIKAPLDSEEKINAIFQKLTMIESLKDELKKVNVKIQFILKDDINSCHFFAEGAEYNDGRERICYVKFEYDKLSISEYKGSRTTPYSSYYRILEGELHKVGIIDKQGIYLIDLSNIKAFQNCIKIINTYIVEKKLFMHKVGKVHDLRIGDKKFYYNTMYWSKDNKDKEVLKMSEMTNMDHILLTKVTGGSNEAFKENRDEILEWFAQIDEIKEFFHERSSYIDKVENFHKTLKS